MRVPQRQKTTTLQKHHSWITLFQFKSSFTKGQNGNVCLSIYLFTGIPVTIYSTIELSDSVIVLGITPQNFRKNPGSAVD